LLALAAALWRGVRAVTLLPAISGRHLSETRRFPLRWADTRIESDKAEGVEMSQDKKLQALDGILAEIFPEEPLSSSNAVPPSINASSEPSGDEPPVQDPAIEPPKDASDPVTIAEHARAALAAQSLDTAIRLRWAVEMRDGTPMLTCTGNLAID
jgi:hypothetical protein